VFIQARGAGRLFDLHPDGERLVVATTTAIPHTDAPTERIIFVSHFFDELRRLAPVNRQPFRAHAMLPRSGDGHAKIGGVAKAAERVDVMNR
jgi:hypothetical protein